MENKVGTGPSASPDGPVLLFCAAPKAFPLWGEGVTAHAVTDEGCSFPRPSRRMAKGTKGSPGNAPGGTTAPRAFRLGPTVRFPPAPQAREPPSGVV